MSQSLSLSKKKKRNILQMKKRKEANTNFLNVEENVSYVLNFQPEAEKSTTTNKRTIYKIPKQWCVYKRKQS